MRVESVAWVTERKDVLFGSFYLAGFYQYIKGKLRGKINHKLIILLFILSLFSKIQAVILPLSMIAVDYYLSGKITKKDIISKWPYFLLSLLFGVVGILFLKDHGRCCRCTLMLHRCPDTSTLRSWPDLQCCMVYTIPTRMTYVSGFLASHSLRRSISIGHPSLCIYDYSAKQGLDQ